LVRAMMVALWGMGAVSLHAQQAKPEDASVVAKEMIRQWVAVEQLIGKESEEWKREKAHISELLELYRKELKLLQKELEVAGGSTEELDKKREKLRAEVADAGRQRRQLAAFILKLRPRILRLVQRFPASLQKQLAEDVLALRGADAETSVRALLKSTLAIFERAEGFQRSISYLRETIQIDGKTWNAEVLYLGLGRAYFYVGEMAGIGTPAASGWKWQRRDEILDDVKKALDVFQKKSPPSLVELPVNVNP